MDWLTVGIFSAHDKNLELLLILEAVSVVTISRGRGRLVQMIGAHL